MVRPYFSGRTLDDVMRSVIKAIQSRGDRISPNRGGAVELRGVLLEISDPRARLSRTETRGKPFSCLGELCWYLAKSNKVDFISYYIPEYKQDAEGDVLFGGYGPRLFSLRGQDQVANVTRLLKERPDSRRAVIQLFDALDVAEEHKDVPCTCTLQLMIRHNALHMFTSMRSNDVIKGLPHDVFSFTMLQEIIARTLSVDLGSYQHAVGSLHLYDVNRTIARQFLNEGWQATDKPMPPMPIGDPWPSIRSLLEAELEIRTQGVLGEGRFEGMDPYWADLVRLLEVLRYSRERKTASIRRLRDEMSSDVYRPFIDARLSKNGALQH